MDAYLAYIFVFQLVFCTDCLLGVELTFELQDNSKQCFYEDIKENTMATLEFQVVTGGQYDVDVTLFHPHGQDLYKEIKSQFGSHNFNATTTGTYAVCFSNEFSTFSHKLIYMDFQVGEDEMFADIGESVTAITQMEAISQNVYKQLNTIGDFQTYHRLREAQGRKRAEDLNERVLWWSALETIAIIAISVTQVLIVRSFFTYKQPIRFK